MRRFLLTATGLVLGLSLSASTANAQWMYPRGYGGYGMSRWGADPGAGYMAGLGAYARGQGVYQLDKAKADAINVDTMVKWNKALRARQAALRAEQEKEAVKQEARREARAELIELRDGTTLNRLLAQVFDADPGVSRSAQASAPISVSAVREIPFEWDSEAITLCIDQMSGTDSLPAPLMQPKYVEERNALRSAVEAALKEDKKGSVSLATRKTMNDAIASFRAKFLKNSSDFELGHQDALDYFTTMAGLSRLLNDPSMKAFLSKIDQNQERTVGDLVAFMNAFNLRFGPATSDRQIEIYTQLVPALTAIRDANRPELVPATPPDKSGQGLTSAARRAFKSMSWDQLEAHRRDNQAD
jgi:hypothetical protein